MNMKKIVSAFLLSSIALFSALADPKETKVTLKGLKPDPALTVYALNRTENSKARLVVRHGKQAQGDRLMIRVFDPEENLVYWQYVEPGRMKEANLPGEGEVLGIPIQINYSYKPGDIMLDVDLPMKQKGVFQIRISAGARNSSVELTLPPLSDYGISFQNGYWLPWDNQPEKMFFYIPPHAETLTIKGNAPEIKDQKGSMIRPSAKATMQIPPEDWRKIWTAEFQNLKKYRFNAYGFPFILCNTKKAADEIKASVIELKDGTVVCFKFQKKIHELLPEILSEKNVGKTENLLANLADFQEKLLKDPLRNQILVNGFDGLLLSINPLLKEQNLDPKSHWSGSFDSWKERIEKAPPENRWDRLKSIKGLWAGASSNKVSAGAEKLAIAATLNTEANPYYGKKELLYRAAAASLRDLMTLGEDEVWRGVGEDPYPGFMGFAVGQKTFPAFGIAAPYMPPKIKDVWTEGLRHIVDRSYPDGLVTARNQSSHYLVAFEAFAEGSGMKRYKELAKDYARRFIAGTHPAGFQIESCGPDASYIGMSHWHMAVYCRMSGDKEMLKTIQNSYKFFNHTVAPEPNGKILGGFNFGHRVADGFYNEQWGGAKGILDGLLPEVGIWNNKKNDKRAAEERIVKTIKNPPQKIDDFKYGPRFNIDFQRYLYYEKPLKTKPWPAKEKKSFIRNFSDELIAVKRPGYYTAIYTGKPAPHPFYVAKRKYFRDPLPNDAENNGGKRELRKVTPYLGSGMTLLWTPEYGSSILSTNWSPLCQHGIVAETENGKRYWADYFAQKFNLDKAKSELTVTGKIEKLPLNFTRSYKFLENEIQVELTLKAEKDIELKKLFENIPVPRGNAKNNDVNIVLSPENKKVDILNKKGNGAEIVFKKPQIFTVQENGLTSGNLQIGRIEVQLPTKMKKGETASLSYSIVPVKK